jgi:DNA (cytosine-5)-methyltransferase 1
MSSLKRNKTRPIGIDLFAGAGGLSLGFEQAGFDVKAAVEIDPIHCATHEFNFPQCKTICASVIDITGNEIRRAAGIGESEIDVVFGGAPCQGFSLIGKRALDDPRNRLVFHYVRIVSELNPKYVVFENVKGLTLGKHAQFLDEFIDELKVAGYKVTLPYKVLNAADFGVPQDRHRLFILASRKDLPLADYPVPSKQRTTVTEAIGDLPDADIFDELLDSDSVYAEWDTCTKYAMRLRGTADDPSNFGYDRIYNRNQLTSSARTVHTELSRSRFLSTEHGKTEPVSRFRKLPPDGRCNTLRAGTDSARGAFTSPRPIHPFLPRVITVREAARLHSYPDWFRFHVTKWHGFRQIGNSVPPLLARAVANRIMIGLGIEPCRPRSPIALGDANFLKLDMSLASRLFRVSRGVIAQRIRRNTVESGDLFKEVYG